MGHRISRGITESQSQPPSADIMNPAHSETPSDRLVYVGGFGILAWHQSAVLGLTVIVGFREVLPRVLAVFALPDLGRRRSLTNSFWELFSVCIEMMSGAGWGLNEHTARLPVGPFRSIGLR